TSQIFDPASSTRTPFDANTIPKTRFGDLGLQVLQHFPLPTNLTATANNFSRTATEPDDQDQFDTRLDRYFGSRHRVFGRYTYFRDDDQFVSPLPDGSGAITSGAIGHQILRSDAVSSEYDLSLSPTALNQLRFGYSRRALNQSSLQNGGLTVPGLPQNAFSSVLPIFTFSGSYQQIGPTKAANSDFTTSIAELLDTFSLVRKRHTIKFGMDLRFEALDIL